MKLSIIIPVYNEEKTVSQILKKISTIKFKDVIKEIIVVDDGSSDNTLVVIKSLKLSGIKLFTHKKNQGKGAAVRTGINNATGEYIVIQDADLEYNPEDINKLLEPIQSGRARVVYGTRLKRLPNFSRDERTIQFFLHYMGNKFLSLITSILYFHWVTDMECCYKLFPIKALEGTVLHARGFEFEPEITVKLLKKGYKMVEVPISTNPRSYGEGKKLNSLKEGPKALWVLIKYRFVD
jgi:glycosyltransferase involved in cell wall biosynthesis